jgi:hypothetical protein
MIKFIDVFDCDGVLLNSLHRYRTAKCGTRIDLEYWIENCTPEKIMADEPLPFAEYYKKCLLDMEHYVIIATARNCQQADYDVIAQKLGTPQHFICRKAGDHQSGVTLKLNGLKRLLGLKQFQNAAITLFEDNMAYLNGVGDAIGAQKVFIQSEQGH